MDKKTNLILASASKIRIDLLKQCKINFIALKSNVDEASLKSAFLSNSDNTHSFDEKIKNYAGNLAYLKADSVSKKHPNSYVIGVDQVGWCDKSMLSKPKDKKQMFDILTILQGKWHYLYCHISIVKNQKQIWNFGDFVALEMRKLSIKEIIKHIDEIPFCKECLGGYKFEEKGKIFFSNYKGDYFTILGLPILPLLNYLNNINYKDDNK